ncbi:MAG: co-chaperone GroES [Candidatus Uhrbacteria bacterium]|nr:co-chaperone GroES [Candidatus Uhrbacteria bacterium]
MKLKPLGNHIVVKTVKKEAVTASGIIIPETAEKERPEQGVVVAVGPGKLLENGTRQIVDLKEGDNIVFKKYSPDEVKLGDDTFLVLSSDDVMAIVE